MASKEYKVVYSTDPEKNRKCDVCGELLIECVCEKKDESVNINDIVAKLRLEKNGRGGKTVSIIDNLPYNEKFVSSLASELKKKLACGGSYNLKDKKGTIEIQGDKLEQIRRFLNEKKIKFKG